MIRLLSILYILLLGILINCDTFAFEHPYKGTYRGYVIKKGHRYASNRGLLTFNGHTMEFDFIFFPNTVYKPKDIAVHKLYGFSDEFQKNSMRIGWRVQQDSIIQVFAYWHVDGKFGYKQLGETKPNIENHAILKVRDDHFIFEFQGVEHKLKGSINGIKHRLFPYFEDGKENGAPHEMTFYIYEY